MFRKRTLHWTGGSWPAGEEFGGKVSATTQAGDDGDLTQQRQQEQRVGDVEGRGGWGTAREASKRVPRCWSVCWDGRTETRAGVRGSPDFSLDIPHVRAPRLPSAAVREVSGEGLTL